MTIESMLDREKMKAFAQEMAGHIRTQDELSQFSRELTKHLVEAALNGEMDHYLGYEKHDPVGRNSGNSRNGYTRKRLQGDHGVLEIEVPRDRNGEFEPQLVEKRQGRITAMDEQILACYARGMSTRDIAATFEEMYGARVSHEVIARVTDSVKEKVTEWQNRPLESLYPFLYLDGVMVKVHQDKRVVKKCIYVALGVNLDGQKELLGLWIAENEGARFWANILDELKQRGVQDILVACVDGLTGFPEAIETVFPKTAVQLCIVHLVRNSTKYVSHKDRKAVCADLKRIYQSVNAEEANLELQCFSHKWDSRYASISKLWERHWPNIIPFFEFPQEIRKAIYTTNAIESLNSVIRKAVNNRKIFPNDTSALKTVFLATEKASRKWTMPIQNWKQALNQLAILYEDRIPQDGRW